MNRAAVRTKIAYRESKRAEGFGRRVGGREKGSCLAVMENPAMEAAVRKIALNKLVLSPANARKTPPSPAEEAELKASIRTRGLKQNLVVHPATDDKGVHAVTAGGRRLKALRELAAEGVIPADYKVPCLVEAAAAALETSLMENMVRAGMHPADEFVAMAGLIDAGQPIEAIATRFGVSERYVKQRLRLGKVAPELLDEFRAGAVTLEVLTAFTLGADHEAQLAVWRQVKDQPYLGAHAVRRLLTQGTVPADSRLGAFVGLADYEAARGAIRCDLFNSREEALWMMRRWSTGSPSRSWKPRPRNCGRAGPGPSRCSTRITASPPNTAGFIRNGASFLGNSRGDRAPRAAPGGARRHRRGRLDPLRPHLTTNQKLQPREVIRCARYGHVPIRAAQDWRTRRHRAGPRRGLYRGAADDGREADR
jgi:ParB/RepB/Spo0J family partition protein